MVIFFFKDLILKSRIKETAGGHEIAFARSVDDLKEQLQNPKFTRLIVDLSMGSQLAAEIQPALRDGLESIAVISHVDLDAHQAAEDAGFKLVMPRSSFVKELPALLQTARKV